METKRAGAAGAARLVAGGVGTGFNVMKAYASGKFASRSVSNPNFC